MPFFSSPVEFRWWCLLCWEQGPGKAAGAAVRLCVAEFALKRDPVPLASMTALGPATTLVAGPTTAEDGSTTLSRVDGEAYCGRIRDGFGRWKEAADPVNETPQLAEASAMSALTPLTAGSQPVFDAVAADVMLESYTFRSYMQCFLTKPLVGDDAKIPSVAGDWIIHHVDGGDHANAVGGSPLRATSES